MALKHSLGPLTAIALAVAVSVWMMSGDKGIIQANAETTNESSPTLSSPEPSKASLLVSSQTSHAQLINNYLTLNGEVSANQTLELASQYSGKVLSVGVQKGDFVKAGQALIVFDNRSLKADLDYARKLVHQRTLELEGVKKLTNQKLTSKVSEAEAEALLSSAKAALTKLEIEMENSQVVAPFSGDINEFAIQTQQWINAGEKVATIVDRSPIKVRVYVPQLYSNKIAQGLETEVITLNSDKYHGKISFVSAVADPDTRALPVDIELDQKASLPIGTSVNVNLSLTSTMAHAVSPALLFINSQGTMSIKTLDDTNKVIENNIEVVRSDRDKVWVTGLPETTIIITSGQGFLKAGDIANVHPVKSEG